MPTGCKIIDQTAVYFLTFTIVQWADILTRQVYRDIVCNSFNHCTEHKGLRVHAYVFMSNHIHCILSAESGNLSGIIRDMKSFTSKRIWDEIQFGTESRREWLTLVCEYAAGGHARNENFQVWSHDNHPEELWSQKFIRQKLDYLHLNPVKAGLVLEPQHWVYSSAADYFYGKQVGRVNISLLEL